MLAVDADAAAIVQVEAEVRHSLDGAATGGIDPVATAEQWARSEFPLRLRCIENWLTERIRGHFAAGGFLTELRPGPYLSQGEAVLNIRELFELVDGVRELKSSLEAPINRGLALEGLLRRFTPERAAGATSPGRR